MSEGACLGKVSIERYKWHHKRFTNKWPNHWKDENDFGGFFRWKLSIETENSHILDDIYRGETYRRLCRILPRWQAYRPVDSSICLNRLETSLERMSQAYNHIRNCTLLALDKVPNDQLRIIWDELGSIKEDKGEANSSSTYSVKATTTPLMLLWGQTLTFDSNVRRNFLEDFPMYPKHLFANNWSFENWKKAMKRVQEDLKSSPEVENYFRMESLEKLGTDSCVPYGRFLDIHYYY